ncbi:hypothetical protein [Singulisphaera sp. PoT]|uniref:hypothetical protein n=1 Tax=Singulisphaera sp. PoT TaxID=3411797 RepID=UPI003BF61B0C
MKITTRFLLALVLVASIGFAALHYATQEWMGGFYLLTHAILILSMVGAICRKPPERALWLGFALCGSIYLWWALHPPPRGMTPVSPVVIFQGDVDSNFDPTFRWAREHVIQECLISLFVASLGGLLARLIFGTSPPLSPDQESESIPPIGRPATGIRRWRIAAIATLAAIIIISAFFTLARRSDPALWVGSVHFATWGILGFLAIGAACWSGRPRMVCFGAALFGIGYMILNRGPDRLVGWYVDRYGYERLIGDQFLLSLPVPLKIPPFTSGFPAESAAVAESNARIRTALEQTIPLTFPDGIPLQDFIKYLRAATRSPDGHEILIHVDSNILEQSDEQAEDDLTMQSPVRVDIEGNPLSASLRVALDDLGLAYQIKDGVLSIVREAEVPPSLDHRLILGHCIMALIAAAIGAGAVPLLIKIS